MVFCMDRARAPHKSFQRLYVYQRDFRAKGKKECVWLSEWVTEEMDGILREFEKLEKKQINKPLISSVDHITHLLEEAKRKIHNGKPPSNTRVDDTDL